jgi:ketosteroid isomerase-like protein
LYAEGANAYAERGLDGLAETWHDEVVYEEDPVFPGAATHRGRAAVLARFRESEEQLGPSAVAIHDMTTGAALLDLRGAVGRVSSGEASLKAPRYPG